MIIYIEGIDRTGKNTLVDYINDLTNYRHCIMARGPISTIVYSKVFNRECTTTLQDIKPEDLLIYLLAYDDDLDTRSKLTYEPHIDRQLHLDTYEKVIREYQALGFHNVKIYNTSESTHYNIAKEVARHAENKAKSNSESTT